MEDNVFRIVEKIEKLKKYDTAIFTTFNFDIEYFEQYILNKLVNAGVNKIYIFVDSEQWYASLKDTYISKLGRRYIVKPVRILASFHPKMSLFLGEDKAKVIIGSGNVTVNGFSSNNEIFNEIDFDKNNKDNLEIVLKAIDFIKEINKCTYSNGDDYLNEVLHSFKYIGINSPKNPNIQLLTNMHNSFVDQVSLMIKESVNEIIVCSPFYDNELTAYRKLKEAFNCKVKVYVQNFKSRFPKQYNENHLIIDDNSLVVFDKVLVGKTYNEKFYHGKVIIFKTNDFDYALYGSANCTSAALVKSHDENGNIEACFIEKCEKNTFDYFLNCFSPILNKHEFECMPLEVRSNQKEDIQYRYGHCDINNEFHAVMRIDASINVTSITVNGLKVNYIRDKDIYKISCVSNNMFDECVTLNIQVITDEQVYNVTGWFIHLGVIKTMFNHNRVNTVLDIEYKNEDLKYNDYYEILENINFNVDKEKRYQYLRRKALQEKEEQDEGDYVMSIEESEEWYFKEKARQKIESVLTLSLHNIVSTYKSYVKHEKKVADDVNKSTDAKEQKQEDRGLDRLFRNLKKFFTSMINQEYIDLVSTRDYMNHIILVESLINKLLKDKYLLVNPDVKSQFADLEYVHKHLTCILTVLLDKEDIYILSDDEKDLIIYMTMYVIVFGNIINNHRVNNNIMLKNKFLVNKLDKVLKISDVFEEYLYSVLVAIEYHNGNEVMPVNFESIYSSYKQYIDSLFDNVTVNKIIGYLKKVYKDNFIVKNNDDKIVVVITTQDIFERSRIISTAKEMIKYFKSTNIPIHLVYERVIQPTDLPTQAIKNEIIINKSSSVLKQKIYRKNGTVDKDKNFSLF